MLTSLHVAKQCDICDQDKPCLVLQSTVGKPAVWYSRDETTGNETTQPFNVSTIRTLFQSHNLLTTEKDLLATIVATGDKSSELWHHIECFRVFARMSPTGKATIIRAIQNPDFNLDDDESTSDLNRVKKTRTRQYDHHVLMCGDGGNDVGALKQADVGLALLSGHANTNTTEVASKPKAEAVSSVVSAEDSLNAHEQALKSRGEAFNAARTAHMKKFQTEYTVKNQERLQEEIRAITERGEYMKMWTVMKENANKVKKALEDENRRFMHLHGQIWDAKDGDGLGGAGSAGGIGGILQQLDSSDASSAGGIPMVRPGDASVAAPFTSRTPSVRSVVDLIRQGRCTLLSALMQQQIMMLESIISAYSLSALSLHNARSSERQLMASQWLILVAALSFSYSSPLDHMHPLRPLKSLFHPAIILSILGQAAIHISCMTLAVRWATDAMGPDKLREVTEFFRKVKANEIDRYASCGDEDYVCQMNAFWMAPFLPNLLNSVVFLVQTSQMISVFFANYKGRPWMKGMMENHALFLSVFVCIAGVVVASWEIIPPLNDMLQLTPFPDDTFRYKVVALVLATIAGTFAWDRFCTLVFAPQTFQAIWAEFTKTTVADFIPIFKTVGMIVAVLLLLSTGNIIIIVGAIYWYRTYFAKANPFAALQQNTQR